MQHGARVLQLEKHHAGQLVHSGITAQSLAMIFELLTTPCHELFTIVIIPGILSRHPEGGAQQRPSFNPDKVIMTVICPPQTPHCLHCRVSRKVAFDFQSNVPTNIGMHEKKQIPCVTSMLTRDLVFTRK